MSISGDQKQFKIAPAVTLKKAQVVRNLITEKIFQTDWGSIRTQSSGPRFWFKTSYDGG